MALYIELPDEPDGYPSMPYWIIEGHIVSGSTLSGWSPERQVLLFDGPAELVARHGAGTYLNLFGGFAEIGEAEGPARRIDRAEYKRLIQGKRRLA